MATVTSLTASRIQELLAGWESVGLSQDEINALVVQLATSVEASADLMDQFYTTDKPHFDELMEANAAAVSDLNDNVIPDMQIQVGANAQAILDLNNITLPGLMEALNNTVINVEERPNIYVQETAPENPDDNDRDLVVGDTWFEPDNTQHIWNGVEWTTLEVDVADFSLTAQKFKTSTHMLY